MTGLHIGRTAADDGQPGSRVSASRIDAGLAVIGGPTVVLDVGGYRIVSDPTFDPPGDFGYLTKTQGPAVPADDLGRVDVVLVSHAAHPDNLDVSGREFAVAAPLVLAPPSSTAGLGPHAQGLPAGDSWHLEGFEITAVPANHGPADAVGDDGYVNGETVGFVLELASGHTVYISGDNVSLEIAADIRLRFGRIDLAVLHAGAASVAMRFGGRPLTLTGPRAAAAAEVLGSPDVVVVHQEGWAHFSEGPEVTRRAFADAGIGSRLREPEPGHWWAPTWGPAA